MQEGILVHNRHLSNRNKNERNSDSHERSNLGDDSQSLSSRA